ncbi:hypothetical protein BpHYR1_047908 [Brachionus plicatilis]|uniref:Uncharacterized protein n=1 Tax=Brachionus plicatilis TaxID=10195 RepID=A0A3M7R060_BRAPC|nr:hypothetical protein BpHYR1_047908 [Brachionus plicatilis]
MMKTVQSNFNQVRCCGRSYSRSRKSALLNHKESDYGENKFLLSKWLYKKNSYDLIELLFKSHKSYLYIQGWENEIKKIFEYKQKNFEK